MNANNFSRNSSTVLKLLRRNNNKTLLMKPLPGDPYYKNRPVILFTCRSSPVGGPE